MRQARIASDDPIWSRLHGPGGVRHVTASLARLARDWDTDMAGRAAIMLAGTLRTGRPGLAGFLAALAKAAPREV